MTASELAVGDYGSIPNGLFHFEDPDPATCSFDISWSGPVTDRSPVSGPSGSSGQLVVCEAAMQWSARTESGLPFENDPNAATTSGFAQLRQGGDGEVRGLKRGTNVDNGGGA